MQEVYVIFYSLQTLDLISTTEPGVFVQLSTKRTRGSRIATQSRAKDQEDRGSNLDVSKNVFMLTVVGL